MATPRMGLRRIEAEDVAIADPVPGQASNKAPMGDDQGVGPIASRHHLMPEGLAALIQGLFAFFQDRPPFLVEVIEAEMRPGLLQFRPRRADVADERRALADAGIDFEGDVKRRGDDFRRLQGAPIRAANYPLDGIIG